ncbi:MAG TPA: hypothetical protein VEY67_01605, partial [Candidatus Dormibacteraeota bacterium]|nr:hypothetical protein [Candidatus Dormibacteraeota bacterium]
MSEALYERYKDALRRGHVAAMHGRSDAALAAYVEAATIAPDRALPHVSIGGVYQRSGRSRDALAAFDAALVRAPRDEGALAGRASALESLGRRSEAATTLDDLAAAQEAAARLADAADTARRALALAESRARRRAVEALVTRLREVEGGAGEAHADALASALRPLGPSGAGSASSDTAGDAGVQPSVGAASSDERPSEQGTADASPAAEPAPPPPLAELLAAWDRAEAAAASGDHASARRLFLELADGHARAGREDAAL